MTITVELTPEQQEVFDIYLKNAQDAFIDMAEHARELISTFDSHGLRTQRPNESAETFAAKADHRDWWVLKKALYDQYETIRELEKDAYRKRNVLIAEDNLKKHVDAAVKKSTRRIAP